MPHPARRASGGVLVAFLTNGMLSVAALFGLPAIFGIAARHNIILATRCQQLEGNGEAFGTEPVLNESRSRERVIATLVTALAIGLALLPFVLFSGIVSQEVISFLAIVIPRGLVISTRLYLRFGV
jgi:Cu/Ag efflux pump CusA